ncbi:MAG: molybdate ABC transporter permease subunit, partial [Cyanophyceae cyanobacterium]
MVAGSIPGRTVTIPIQIFLAAESGTMDTALAWVGVAIAVALGAITLLHWLSGAQQLSGAKLIVRAVFRSSQVFHALKHKMMGTSLKD